MIEFDPMKITMHEMSVVEKAFGIKWASLAKVMKPGQEVDLGAIDSSLLMGFVYLVLRQGPERTTVTVDQIKDLTFGEVMEIMQSAEMETVREDPPVAG